jgi:glycosyltransferase involved in cell wall biosynthesis
MVYGNYHLASEWVRLGHHVTIVTASYAHTRYTNPDTTIKITESHIDDIRYIWVPTPKYNPENKLGRIINIFCFTLSCLARKLAINSADLVVCSSPHPFAIYPAYRFAKRAEARLVYEVRDLWPLTLMEMSNTSAKHPFIKLMQKAEDFAYNHADNVVSVLQNASKYMTSRGLDPNKFYCIPNGIDLSASAKPLPDSHLNKLKDHKNKHKFIIAYAGKLGISNDLATLIKALAKCNDGETGIAIMGDGAELENLRSLASNLAIEKQLLFLEPVAKAQVHSFLQHTDAAYIGLQAKPLFKYGASPTKLNDYMLAAKPIICAIDAPELSIEESGCGIVCEPENTESVAAAILRIKKLSDTERSAMGAKAKRWVEAHRDYRVLAEKYLSAVTPE